MSVFRLVLMIAFVWVIFSYVAWVILPDLTTTSEKISLLACLASISGLFTVVAVAIETANYDK